MAIASKTIFYALHTLLYLYRVRGNKNLSYPSALNKSHIGLPQFCPVGLEYQEDWQQKCSENAKVFGMSAEAYYNARKYAFQKGAAWPCRL
jgi:hypothetical protein